jgi:hypothetical protein
MFSSQTPTVSLSIVVTRVGAAEELSLLKFFVVNARIVFSGTLVDLFPCTYGLLIPIFELLLGFAAQRHSLILSDILLQMKTQAPVHR